MICKCGSKAVKNGKRHGKQWYLCKVCGESFKDEPSKPTTKQFEKFAARTILSSRENRLTVKQVADFLGHEYITVYQWVNRGEKPAITTDQFKQYLKDSEHGSDILYLLGGAKRGMSPSEHLTKILAPAQSKPKRIPIIVNQEKVDEFVRLVTMPIKNRKGALAVLYAMLVSPAPDSATFSVDTIKNTITFRWQTLIQTIRGGFSSREYPLIRIVSQALAWLKLDKHNKLFVDEHEILEHIKDKTNSIYQSKADLQKALKQILYYAGASRNEAQKIFGYKLYELGNLDERRLLFDSLQGYIDKRAKELTLPNS